MMKFKDGEQVVGFWFVGSCKNYLMFKAYIQEEKMKFDVDIAMEDGFASPEFDEKSLSAKIKEAEFALSEIPNYKKEDLERPAFLKAMWLGVHRGFADLGGFFASKAMADQSGGAVFVAGPITTEEANKKIAELPWERLMGTEKAASC